ncbi:hypothetical protein EFK50_01225 [Nocardioides marmoriginsengisoli]|uniref:Uncharacterized protein n=1 Tax=Nocardioides marmoriginsengisoli TaxID=661483 RepID=A0A3N0CS41_9ACTN|nr:hypothetical protein EFK50_01225 [Nocardioides marmoriginsengisoli]
MEALAWTLLCAIYPEHQARTIRNFPCDDTWTDCQDQARAAFTAGYLSPAQVAEEKRAAAEKALQGAVWEVQGVINHWSNVPASVADERFAELADLETLRDRIAERGAQ